MIRAQFQTKKKFSSAPGTLFGFAPLDIVKDIVLDLVQKNDPVLDNLSGYTGSFRDRKVIELVFLLSEFWCQDSATKYQAVEILDRFMILYIEKLHTSCMEAKRIPETLQAKSWSLMKGSLCDNFLLHLVSCIQIASKLCFHCHIINNSMVLQFLQLAGYTYKKDEVVKSELTVLKTLHFQLNVLSPLSYVEILLEVLGHSGCSLSLEHLRDMCLMVLDLVYLVRNPIYEMLLETSMGMPMPSRLQRSKFVSVKEDQMLLATGVITTSACILNQDSVNKVLDILNYITGITINNMTEISSSILKHCFGTAVLCNQ
ncbi:cyclin N-terminal domain-containing protein 1 [Spea bombifrons]|uniref:cyclin N-terminal domain-containing protein 1 n=1 Tax=Spea bombifrons TaxID=233779 RepID=UPI002349D003|nr:cyclin N-terminal domain-containing protein 1 [Spea bombifrons]